MKLVLVLNNFVFNGVNYLQKKGPAVGTRAAPNFANVFVGYFENRFVYQSRLFKRFIKSWWRYIDDIFMLWKGPRKPLEDFLNYLNEVHPSIKFEWKISKQKASFLDCDVIKENNKLKTDVYQKAHRLSRIPRLHIDTSITLQNHYPLQPSTSTQTHLR